MQNRKDEHVELALEDFKKSKPAPFNKMRLMYQSLPSVDLEDIDISTHFCGFDFEAPFYINAMTGGSLKTLELNQQLAEIAHETGIAIASGSLSSALKDESTVESFKVLRTLNPKGIVMANIGAEYHKEDAQKVVDLLDADILQIHLNVIQELVMPEGDRTFKHWIDNIKEIVEYVNVPVIVKEVGFGMSAQTIEKLLSVNVKTIDVSGAGGTNFVTIENQRRVNKEYEYLEDFGISTIDSLILSQPYQNQLDVLASGGIKNPLDILKSLVLGAKAVGISGLILHTLITEGKEETIALINRYKYELKVLMILVDCKDLNSLRSCNYNLQ